jgi:fumarate reductase flavoprotein subunit
MGCAGAAADHRGGRRGNLRGARGKGAGVGAVVIERNAVPGGSSALSAGLVPSAGARF